MSCLVKVDLVSGVPGVAGPRGWSPVLAVEEDGERRVHRIADWTGSGGTKPPTGLYIGADVLVASKAQAVDIRGPQGPMGDVTPEALAAQAAAEDAAERAETAAIGVEFAVSYAPQTLDSGQQAQVRSNIGISAANTPIADAGEYFNADDLEEVTQEIGAHISRRLTPERFGANGTGDARAALLELIAESDATGKPIDWGSKTHDISAAISVALTKAPHWEASGAVIRNISDDPLQSTIVLSIDSVDVDIRGLTFDANMLAYNALEIYSNSSMANARDLLLEDVCARNAYRSGMDFNGGVGIRLNGGFRLLHLVRPTVHDCYVHPDAQIPSTVGISGIAILETVSAEARHVIIDRPDIRNILAQDGNRDDQDGIIVKGLETFTSGPNGSSVEINNGFFLNCGGRSIKFQRHSATVNNPYFTRDANGNKTGGRINMEIDFQFGSGKVKGGQAYYTNHACDDIIYATMRTGVSQGVTVEDFDWWAHPTNAYAPLRVISRQGGNPHSTAPTAIRRCRGSGQAVPMLVEYTAHGDHVNPNECLTVSECGGVFGNHLIGVVASTGTPTISVVAQDNHCDGTSRPLVTLSGGAARTADSISASFNNRNFS